MAANIPPAYRAELDQKLQEMVDGLLSKAAELDGVDVIEANVDLTHYLLGHFDLRELAVSAAALALTMHRRGGQS